MTTTTCGHCGKDLTVSSTGRPKAYCDDRCRNAAREARAAKQVRADQMPAPAPETRQRPSYGRGLGDGDDCPQDRSHGAMYFMKPGTRQWCPSSRHQGDPYYAHDGVTPAPRARHDLAQPSLGADVEQGRAEPEASASDFPGASLLPTSPAAAARQLVDPSRYLAGPSMSGNTTDDVGRSSPFPGVADVQPGPLPAS